MYIFTYIQDLSLTNLQVLICHKAQLTNEPSFSLRDPFAGKNKRGYVIFVLTHYPIKN